MSDPLQDIKDRILKLSPTRRAQMLSLLKERKEQLGYGLDESRVSDLVHINEQIDELAQVHALASDRWQALSEQGQLMAQAVASALNCPEIPLGDSWPRPDQAHCEFERLALSTAEDAEAEDLTDVLWAEAGRQAEEDPTLSGAALGRTQQGAYVGLVSLACGSFFKGSADSKLIDGIRELAEQLGSQVWTGEGGVVEQLSTQTASAMAGHLMADLHAVPAIDDDDLATRHAAFVDAVSALSVTINTAREELTHLELTASLLAIAIGQEVAQ